MDVPGESYFINPFQRWIRSISGQIFRIFLLTFGTTSMLVKGAYVKPALLGSVRCHPCLGSQGSTRDSVEQGGSVIKCCQCRSSREWPVQGWAGEKN